MDATLLGQKGPTGTYTYPNPNQYFILKMLIISFIFIENKGLSDAIWDLKKGEKKVSQKADSNPGRTRQKECNACFIICATAAKRSFSLL